jgi:hypothetical protein
MNPPPLVWEHASHDGECIGERCSNDVHWRSMRGGEECGGEEREKWRANYLPSPHFYKLNAACVIVNKAFGRSYGCYLVGSSIRKRDFRDVDVRLIMEDAAYDEMFKNDHGYTNPLWSLMCVTISEWLSGMSGLPIDFQIQRMTQANTDHSMKTGHERQPLGIFHDYPGERPTDLKMDAQPNDEKP